MSTQVPDFDKLAGPPVPRSNPLGDGHHSEIAATEEDEMLGQHLAHEMGDLFLNSWNDSPVKQWTRIAVALRIHRLQLVDGAMVRQIWNARGEADKRAATVAMMYLMGTASAPFYCEKIDREIDELNR